MKKKAIFPIFFLLAILAASSKAGLDDGLVAHWKFDEGSGSTAYDSAGTNDGTLVGDPVWATGQIGTGALSFDGDGDYVDCGSNPVLMLRNNLSIVFWFNSDTVSASYRGIVGTWKASAPSESGYMVVQQNDGCLHVNRPVGSSWNTINSVFSVTDGNWHHVVVVYSTSGTYLYVDGSLNNSNSINSDINPPSKLTIASTITGSGCLDGFIDDVRIYNRALAAEEVEELYWSGMGFSQLAINRTLKALVEKIEAILTVNDALEKEQQANEALEQLLQSGDYEDLQKRDITKAQRITGRAMRQQQRAKTILEKSIANLKNSLAVLGWHPPMPIAHWKFDERSGSTAYDSAGGNDGVIHDANWTSGLLDGALSFDGNNDYVEIGPGVLPVGKKSIFAWIKLPPVGQGAGNPYDYFIYHGKHGIEHLIFYFNDGKELRWRNFQTGGFDTKYPTILDDDEWHLVGAGFDGLIHSLYLDGKRVAVSGGIDHTPITTEEGIGGFNDALNRSFLGKIDDVRIYDTALVETEVQLLYYNELE